MARKLTMAGAGWVDGERFFGRERDLERLTGRVTQGTHTLLTAPRRMGKTSLVRELLRRLEKKEKFETIYIDLEGAANPPDMVATLAGSSKTIINQLTSIFDSIIERVEKLNFNQRSIVLRKRITEDNWRDKGDKIFEKLAKIDSMTVLAIDEFPVFINRMLGDDSGRIDSTNRANVELFMAWLRKNSQTHQRRVCLILTGSIGLSPVLRRAKLTALANGYEPYSLEPWQHNEASECLEALARGNGLELSKAIRQDMCKRLDYCVPHHVQMFFSRLHHHLQRRCQYSATLEDVKVVYENDMVSTWDQLDFDHDKSRLESVLGRDGGKIAHDLLTKAARTGGFLADQEVISYRSSMSPTSKPAPTTLDSILETLQHDSYIRRDDGGYRIVSQFFKDWWYARHCTDHETSDKKGDSS